MNIQNWQVNKNRPLIKKMDACEKYELIYVKSTNKIIMTKMCKIMHYGHGQCIICVTLKLQVMSHFLQSL
jgi:hypothetical protein